MNRILMAGVVTVAALGANLPAFAQWNTDSGPYTGPAARESRSDVRVQERVEERLLADRRLDGALFTVAVHDGHVSVTGSLKDLSQEAEIYRVARGVEGARDVFVFAEEDAS